MKLLSVAITFLVASFATVAQTNQKYIEVAGTADYRKQVAHFEAVFTINATPRYSYNDEQPPTMEALQKRFLLKATEMGLEKNQIQLITDEKRAELKMLKSENTQSYVVETTNENEVLGIISLQDMGAWIYKFREKVTYKPFANKEKIIALALKDARENANVVAKAMNVRVGEILSITDHYYEDQLEAAYYSKTVRKYRIAVRFEIK